MTGNQEAHNQEARNNQDANNQDANNQDAKNRQWLNNYVGKRNLGELVWKDDDKLIPGNRHIWTSTVQLGEITYGQGRGGTKGAAREQASEQALAALKIRFGPYNEHHD